MSKAFFKKNMIVDTPFRYEVSNEDGTSPAIKKIEFKPANITQLGDKVNAEDINGIQENSIYEVEAVRVVEGVNEFYDIAIAGINDFTLFNAKLLIKFNETNTKVNPQLRILWNSLNKVYPIRFLNDFTDIQVNIGDLKKEYIGYINQVSNKFLLWDLYGSNDIFYLKNINYKITNEKLISLRNGTNKKIVAIGDSVTYGDSGNGGQIPTPWTITLQKLLRDGFNNQNIEVVNKGINGNTSTQGLARFDNDVINLNPDLVLIMFGHNDTRTEMNISINKYYDNLLAMGKKCQNAGIGVIFLMPTPRLTNLELAQTDVKNGKVIQEYARTMQFMANQNGFLVIDTYNEVKDMIIYSANSEGSLMADGAHFRQEMANRFAGILYNFAFYNGDLSVKTNDLITPNGNNYFSKGIGLVQSGGSDGSQLFPSSRKLISLSNNGELYLQFYWKGEIENPVLKSYITLDNSISPSLGTIKIEYADIIDNDPVVLNTKINTNAITGYINSYPVYTGKSVIYGLNIFKLTSGINGVLFSNFQVIEPYKNVNGLVLNNLKDVTPQGAVQNSRLIEHKGYNELVTGFKANTICKGFGKVGSINIPVNTRHQYRLRFDYSGGGQFLFGNSKGVTWTLPTESDGTPYNRIPIIVGCSNGKLIFFISTPGTNAVEVASISGLTLGNQCQVDIIIKNDNTFELWFNSTKVFTSEFPFPSGDVLMYNANSPYLYLYSFIEIDPDVQNVGVGYALNEMWFKNGQIFLWNGTTLRTI